MSKAGRTTLTKVTLFAISIHVSIAVLVPLWIYQTIDKLHRALWNDTTTARGGHCLVAWSMVLRPVDMGRLGVIDLTTMGVCPSSYIGVVVLYIPFS
jgi:hypothetical protein